MCEKLKEEIPRQLFEIPIQAAIGEQDHCQRDCEGHAERTCWPSVTAEISAERRKLLEKQKEGKKRMRQVGNVEIPQKAFMSVLKLDDK